MSTLRHYQKDSSDAIVEHLNSPPAGTCEDGGIVVAPTGTGKSHIAADVAHRTGRLVVIQPGQELLTQNFKKHLLMGERAAIYSASFHSRSVGNTTFATIQSIYQKGHLFKGFTALFDECDRFPAKTESMIGQFMRESGIKKYAGLTATPFRMEGGELTMLTRCNPRLFGKMLHLIQVQDVIDWGFWANLTYTQSRYDDSQLVWNSEGTDFTDESLDAAYEANRMQQGILAMIEEMKAEGRKSIIVFVPNVAKAIELQTMYGNGSGVLYSGMKDKDSYVWNEYGLPTLTRGRESTVKGFKDQSLEVLFNVNIAAVGFDHPPTDGIIHARDTGSLQWYYQGTGRGTRPHENKKNCRIHDFTGNFARFGKIEDIEILDIPNFGWNVCGNHDGRIFSGVNVSKGIFTTKNFLTNYQFATAK